MTSTSSGTTGRSGAPVLRAPTSGFMAARATADREHIMAVAQEVAGRMDAWAAGHPLIRRVRVWPLALSVTAAAPFGGVEALLSTAKVSLWVFTLDDVFDETLVPPDVLLRRLDTYKDIARGKATVAEPGDGLAPALREVYTDLARYPLFGALGADWASALEGTIDGMVREEAWRAASKSDAGWTPPTYNEYVANGLYSIGGPPHIWAALITTDDPSTPRCLPLLRGMEQEASTCVRLANDLRSYAREMAEGKLNSIGIAARVLEAQGVPAKAATEQAEARVRAHIGAGLERLAQLQNAGCSATGQPEAAVADIARFVCEFYSRYDYHTFTRPEASTNGD